MAIKYREDPDLEFLQFCDNKDLEILVNFLTRDKDGELRLTEELTSEEKFVSCNGNFQQIWDLIAGELQLFGADSLATLVRGGIGILYREILTDVCGKLKVDYDKQSEIVRIEQNLLLKVVEDSLEEMTDDQKKEFASQMNLNVAHLLPATIASALQVAVQAGGFASYRLAVIVANSIAKTIIGRGLSLTVNASLTRALAIFAGPIGWAISGILTLPLITGPAYRVTIPSVIQIAYMRQSCLNKDIIKGS